MTGPAIRKRVNFVLLYQLRTELLLIRGRLVRNAENLILWTHVIFGMPMAIETPGHLERVLRPCKGHGPDRTVARCAPNTLSHMNAVIEINKLGKRIDAYPFDRAILPKALAHWLQHRAISPDLRMAGHTGFRGRQSSKRGFLDRGMTVAAIDSQLGRMMSMAKRHRLHFRDVGFRDIGRAIDPIRNKASYHHEKKETVNREPRNQIRAVMKDLRHDLSFPSGSKFGLLRFQRRGFSSQKSKSSADSE